MIKKDFIAMENKQYTTRELFRRFAPYFKKYRFTLWMDLFCH